MYHVKEGISVTSENKIMADFFFFILKNIYLFIFYYFFGCVMA